jgi:hypothetical protein
MPRMPNISQHRTSQILALIPGRDQEPPTAFEPALDVAVSVSPAETPPSDRISRGNSRPAISYHKI